MYMHETKIFLFKLKYQTIVHFLIVPGKKCYEVRS